MLVLYLMSDNSTIGYTTKDRSYDMGRIVAIGGGELPNTKKLNEYAVKLSGKVKPNLLFIGTASHDAPGYIQNIHAAFEPLNCVVSALKLTDESSSADEIDTLLSWADIIYVGGGDTRTMMEIWKKYDVDRKLESIYEQDEAVLMGLSAGAICWFNCGHSDSEAFTGKENWSYIFVDGMLDIFHYALCPHYNEKGRESFDVMLKEKDMPGIELENQTAFVENNGEKYILRENNDVKAYFLQYKNGQLEKTEMGEKYGYKNKIS